MPVHKPVDFLQVAYQCGALRKPPGHVTETCFRRFRALFGCMPRTCTLVWGLLALQGVCPRGAKTKHLLWTLYVLKVYCTENATSRFFDCDEKTLRLWVWKLISAISSLDVVWWENRFMNDNGSVCKVSIDGTDCPIKEPSPFSPMWYSHKINGPGLRYEVGVCLQTGWIVWVHGPFPCGAWSDLRISRHAVIYELCEGEKFLADGGYRDGNSYSETPTGLNNEDQRMKQMARARHETVNSRIKRWAILASTFRHPLTKHGLAFHAIANITQIQIESGERLFGIEYNDRY